MKRGYVDMIKFDRIRLIIALLGGIGLGIILGSRYSGDFFTFVGTGITMVAIILFFIIYFIKEKYQ